MYKNDSQQLEMCELRTSRIADRIVEIGQPHVRPIIRDKAGKKVEFGEAKRKGSLDRIIAKLAHTSESMIHVGWVIVLNLGKWLRKVIFWLKTSFAAGHAVIRAAHRVCRIALCVQLSPSASPFTTGPSSSNYSLAV